MPRLTTISVELNLPFLGKISGQWAPEGAERVAAWEMYVELATRISTQPLGSDEGLIREAFNSYYSLFGTTRSILREHGPRIAKPSGGRDLSFGYLALAVLNGALRPLLSRWHPGAANPRATASSVRNGHWLGKTVGTRDLSPPADRRQAAVPPGVRRPACRGGRHPYPAPTRLSLDQCGG